VAKGEADAAPQAGVRRQDGRVSQALSDILGFKLAFYDNGQVRVESQYDLGAAFALRPAARTGSNGNGNVGAGAARMQLVEQGVGVKAFYNFYWMLGR
jgi:mitotic spindle assembly checkpoint protein MAD1